MARPGLHVLLVDDDRNFRRVTAYALEATGFVVSTAANGAAALELLSGTSPDVILCDLKMPVMDGLAFLGELRARAIDIPVVMVTAFGSIDGAVEAMQAGAINYVTKPINREELRLAIKGAADLGNLRRENRRLREQVAGGRAADRLIGSSPAMEQLRQTLARLAESDAPVLITGESGVGKELVARALHADGPRSQRGSFVVLNCAAVPGDLLESLLFGHRKGAFTGATADRQGKLEAADGGTLLLDEIGDMPLELQAKLLRTLQEGEIERLGDTQPAKIDARVVSATNQPLARQISEGRFRQDLFYRLAVVPIEIPPLRERIEDLPALLHHLLERHGAPDAEVPAATLSELQRRPWPGNVRELENLVMRACALNPGLRSLSPELVKPMGPEVATSLDLHKGIPIKLPEDGISFEEVEHDLLAAAWEQSGHNQTRGAELLGLPRQAFSYRLQKYGIIPKHSRGPADDDH